MAASGLDSGALNLLVLRAVSRGPSTAAPSDADSSR